MSGELDDTWTRIGDLENWIAFRPPPAEGDWHAIRFRAGLVEGAFGTPLASLPAFVAALQKFDTQRDAAALDNAVDDDPDARFSLAIRAKDRLGHLVGAVSVHCASDPALELHYEVSFDQSHLPSIIAGLRRNLLMSPQ